MKLSYIINRVEISNYIKTHSHGIEALHMSIIIKTQKRTAIDHRNETIHIIIRHLNTEWYNIIYYILLTNNNIIAKSNIIK